MLDFVFVGGGIFYFDVKMFCFYCYELCFVRKNLLEFYGCGDEGSEIMYGICIDNYINCRWGKFLFKVVGLCYEYYIDICRF